MYIPPELVHDIISFVLDPPAVAADERGVSFKHDWSSLEALTLTSKAYRTLALNAWFRTLFIKVPSDIHVLQAMFPDVAGAIKQLHCVQTHTKSTSVWNLRGLTHLSTVRLDWLSPSMMPHYGSKDPADRLPFTNVSSSVTELDIRGLPWPSPMVFHNIHNILPDLNILRLRQERIWCGLCHTCSVARFTSPGPEEIIYKGGGGLPMHYARAFGSLQHLHTVTITIADFGGGKTTLQDGEEHNPYLWAGECDRCMEIMYEDDVFRDEWVARKKGLASTDKEPHRSTYVAPPALKRVEWRFWRSEGSEEMDVQESEDELSETSEESS
ncbi:hypothetical protein FPV67DRAFT_1416680 [Lyophyllum atratum]|nr:hypothetical protein FPV67DRAFT_1416680 [Lyophyllum atratum]